MGFQPLRVCVQGRELSLGCKSPGQVLGCDWYVPNHSPSNLGSPQQQLLSWGLPDPQHGCFFTCAVISTLPATPHVEPRGGGITQGSPSYPEQAPVGLPSSASLTHRCSCTHLQPRSRANTCTHACTHSRKHTHTLTHPHLCRLAHACRPRVCRDPAQHTRSAAAVESAHREGAGGGGHGGPPPLPSRVWAASPGPPA